MTVCIALGQTCMTIIVYSNQELYQLPRGDTDVVDYAARIHKYYTGVWGCVVSTRMDLHLNLTKTHLRLVWMNRKCIGVAVLSRAP
jgi:hypothetical protein